MRIDVGVSRNALTAYALVAMQLLSLAVFSSSATSKPTAAASSAASKKTKPFRVWFRAEPNLPRKRDMKADKLNRLIGSDYNEMWMSKTAIKTPDVNVTGAFADKSQSMTGPGNIQFPEQLPAQYQEMMRTWLVHRGLCPVEFSWTDLGKSFWPRWIKKGTCGRSDMMSCSWPPGMSCIPSSIRVLNLLRWHCWLKNRKSKRKEQQRKMMLNVTMGHKTTGRVARENGRAARRKKKKKNDKFRCLWIKVPYPVTEDCMCSCKKLEN